MFRNLFKKKEFKIGDVVMLKSGGPLMTVEGFTTNQASIECRWFVDRNTDSRYFKQDMIHKVGLFTLLNHVKIG